MKNVRIEKVSAVENDWQQGFHGPVSVVTDVTLDGQESFEWKEYAQFNEVLRATAAINGDGEETAPFGYSSSDRFQTIETVDERLLLVLFCSVVIRILPNKLRKLAPADFNIAQATGREMFSAVRNGVAYQTRCIRSSNNSYLGTSSVQEE